MGWKNVRDHYRIGHNVQVTDAGICIGSSYIHNIIVVGLDGTILKADGHGNEDLKRYIVEMQADPAKLKSLIDTPDTFTADLIVWTYDGGDIIEKRCEEYGWPNCTHDGEMMYDNVFFVDRSKAVTKAIENSLAGLEMALDRVKENRERLERSEEYVREFRSNLHKLAREV